MKKLIGVLLSLVMLMSTCICVGSAEQATTDAAPEQLTVVEFADLGFKYVFPEAYGNANGLFRWVEWNGEPDFWYIGITEEMIETSAYKDEIRSNNLVSFDTMRKWCDELNASFSELFLMDVDQHSLDPNHKYVYNFGGTTLGYIESNTGRFIKFETNKTSNKFLEYWAENGIRPDFYIDDIKKYGTDTELFVSGFQPMDNEEIFTYTPVGFSFTPEEKEQLQPVHFETTDLDGNPVKSEELFAGHKVTMINIWATWCQPCEREMPAIEEIAADYAEDGCQIIGICDDASSSNIATVKSLLSGRGVTYLNLKPPAGMENIFGNYAYPNSFFVDSEGNFLVRSVGDGGSRCRLGVEAALEAAEG